MKKESYIGATAALKDFVKRLDNQTLNLTTSLTGIQKAEITDNHTGEVWFTVEGEESAKEFLNYDEICHFSVLKIMEMIDQQEKKKTEGN